MRTLRLFVLLVAGLGSVFACGDQPSVGGGGGGTGGLGGGSEGSGGGGGTGGGNTGGGELPCAAATLLTDHCISCHGAVLASGAPIRILTRADLLSVSAIDATQSVGQRSVVRMRQAVAAMPPSPAAPVAEPKLSAFESWVSSGMPAGQCQSTDGGAGGGAGGGSGGGSGGAGGGGGGGGGGNAAYDGGIAGLPCDVAAMVANKCASCHRTPATGGATFALLSRSDFLAPSTIPNKNRAQQSQVRLATPSNPMPPVGSAGVTSAEHATFDSWVNAGTPAGSCGAVDAGTTDAGPSPTVCSSNVFWTQGNTKSESMNPGLACRGCHVTKAPFQAYYFAGTAYSSLHEEDTCDAVPPPAGTKIEILDKNGAVATTLTPNAVGNFHYALIINLVQMPYTARIVSNGRTSTMTTQQTETDCNSCHTEQGKNGAAGRIVWP